MGKHKHVDASQHAAKKPHGSTKKLKTKPDNISRQTENKNTAFQHPYEAAKAVLRRKFTEIQAYPKKQENSQIQVTI